MHSLCKWACVLLYLCYSFASFCYVLSLLICTELLPTYLVAWLIWWLPGYLPALDGWVAWLVLAAHLANC